MKYEYLIFDILIWVMSSLGVWSFSRRVWPVLGRATVSILSVSIPYILWDMYVTDKWWVFNEKYILGWKAGGLPIEEVLFFLVIPWSCLLIWINLKKNINGKLGKNGWERWLTIVMAVVMIWGWWTGKWYTVTVSGLALIFGWGVLVKAKLCRNKAYVLFLGIVLMLTLVFNGYLTARPVVIYNEMSMSGIRLLTVPIEDFFYGLILVGMVVFVYELITEKTFLGQHRKERG